MDDLQQAFAPVGAADTASVHTQESAVLTVTPSATPPSASLLQRNPQGRPPDHVWHYTDAAGGHLLCVCRWDEAAGKTYRQLTPAAAGWRWKGHPEPHPLYGLARLAAHPEAPVLVVEGEKTADAAQRLLPAWVVITWPGGSGAPGKAQWQPLAGRVVTLWPDADTCGTQAMATVSLLLMKDLATEVRTVNLEHVAAALGHDLPQGWDLADAPNAWTSETVAGIIATAAPAKPRADLPAVIPQAPVDPDELHAILGMDPSRCDDEHLRMVTAGLGSLAAADIAIDARGSWRDQKTWARRNGTVATLARTITFDLRRYGPTSSDKVQDALEEIVSRKAMVRRREIYATMLGHPADPCGIEEARRWLQAVMRKEPTPADLAALRHWLWLVKVKQAGRHGDHHLMIVVVGRYQGSGKSTAVQHLCGPWAELFDPAVGVELLTDDRSAPALSDLAIGCWDELSGIGRADVARLKTIITASEVAYRPMRTNTRSSLPQRTTFIATSNLSLGELVRDSTGCRRFYEIAAPTDRPCDWETINRIDYDLLWRSVSENDRPPILEAKAQIDAIQAELVVLDPIDRWLAEEAFGALETPTDAGGRAVEPLPARDPCHGVPTRELLIRCATWCRCAAERPPTDIALGRRLKALGWTTYRTSKATGQVPGYRMPSTLSNPEHPEQPACPPVLRDAQGAHPELPYSGADDNGVVAVNLTLDAGQGVLS